MFVDSTHIHTHSKTLNWKFSFHLCSCERKSTRVRSKFLSVHTLNVCCACIVAILSIEFLFFRLVFFSTQQCCSHSPQFNLPCSDMGQMRSGFVQCFLHSFRFTFYRRIVVFSFRVCDFVSVRDSTFNAMSCLSFSSLSRPALSTSISFSSIWSKFLLIHCGHFRKIKATMIKTNGVWGPYKWPQWLGWICNFQHLFDLYILLCDQFRTHTKNTQITSIHATFLWHGTVRRWNIFIVDYMQKCLKNWIIATTKKKEKMKREKNGEEYTILIKINRISHRMYTLSFSCACACVCADHCEILCTEFQPR